MKSIKKICLLISIITFVLTLTSCSNSPRRTIYESGYFQYKILDIDRDGVKEILIMGLTEEGKQQETIVIPTVIDEYEVVSLGHNNGFQGEQGYIYSYNLRKIYITNHIKNIGNDLFFNSNDGIERTLFIGNAYGRDYRWDSILDSFDNIFLAKKIKEINFPSSEDFDNKCSYANVLYDLNYGENNIFLVDDCDGTTVNVLPPNPIRQGYNFIGWYKEPECINLWDFENDIVPAKECNENGEYILKETILYAKWEEQQ